MIGRWNIPALHKAYALSCRGARHANRVLVSRSGAIAALEFYNSLDARNRFTYTVSNLEGDPVNVPYVICGPLHISEGHSDETITLAGGARDIEFSPCLGPEEIKAT